MDKREDDILDDILDEESDENLDEDSDEMKLPETLMGESADENTEIEDEHTDQKIEEALSKFLDDDKDDKKEPDKNSKKSGKELDREEIEREIRAKIAKEKKEKLKQVQKIAVICAAVIVVAAAGLFAFFQFAKAGNSYIVKFDNKNISVEEFKFFMLLNALNQTASDKQSAYNGLMDFLVMNKAAKDKNVELTEEDKEYIKSNAEYIKNYLESNNIALPKISDERLEEIVGVSVSGVVPYKLLDIVAQEAGYTVDEGKITEEFNAYQSEDKLLKYIITETPEAGEVAREALISGVSADEAVMSYSTYYLMYGIETLNASALGFDAENYDKIMALAPLEFSEVIDLGGIYGVFIAVTYEETRDAFRNDYTYKQKNQLFLREYEFWKSEAKEQRNEKVFENFDEEEFFNTVFGG